MNRSSLLTLSASVFLSLVGTAAVADGSTHKYFEGPKAKALYQACPVRAGVTVNV